jgi:hypothetical protein
LIIKPIKSSAKKESAMKKWGFLSLVLLQLVLLPGLAEAKLQIGFKAYGGLSFLGVGDLNTGLQGRSDLYSDIWATDLYSTSANFKPASIGMDFGGEILIQFNPHLAVGLGVGYLQTTKTSEVPYTNPIAAMPELKYTWKVKANAIPIKANFYYFLPLSGSIAVNIHAGLSYYLAKAYGSYRLDWGTYWEENVYNNLPGGGIGFQGGIGLEYKLSSRISFFLEGQGRYAAFSNFEGDEKISYSNGIRATRTGKLWRYDTTWTGKTYTVIIVQSTKPSDPNFLNCREAKVDFSGFSLVLGVLFRL